MAFDAINSNGYPKHLYRQNKSPYWWVRVNLNGKRVRRSTKVIEVSDAVAIRDRWLADAAKVNRTSGWTTWVAEQLNNSNSWARLAWSRMLRKTKRRKLEPRMLLSELGQVLARCNGLCEISGVSLEKPTESKPTEGKRRLRPFTPSFDRIDSSKGYTADNTRVVCLALNLAMNQWGEENIRRLSRLIVAQELSRNLDILEWGPK